MNNTKVTLAPLEADDREQIFTAVFDVDALAAFREKFPAWRDADEFVLK